MFTSIQEGLAVYKKELEAYRKLRDAMVSAYGHARTPWNIPRVNTSVSN